MEDLRELINLQISSFKEFVLHLSEAKCLPLFREITLGEPEVSVDQDDVNLFVLSQTKFKAKVRGKLPAFLVHCDGYVDSFLIDLTFKIWHDSPLIKEDENKDLDMSLQVSVLHLDGSKMREISVHRIFHFYPMPKPGGQSPYTEPFSLLLSDPGDFIRSLANCLMTSIVMDFEFRKSTNLL